MERRAFKIMRKHNFYRDYFNRINKTSDIAKAIQRIMERDLGESSNFRFIIEKDKIGILDEDVPQEWLDNFKKNTSDPMIMKKTSKLYKSIEKELGKPIDVPYRPPLQFYIEPYISGAYRLLKDNKDLYVLIESNSPLGELDQMKEIEVWKFEKLDKEKTK